MKGFGLHKRLLRRNVLFFTRTQVALGNDIGPKPNWINKAKRSHAQLGNEA
jgi:hypothetical protein